MNEESGKLLAIGAPQRLHPLTMVTRLGDVLKQAWGGAAAGAYFIYQGRYEIAAMIVAAVLVGSLIRPLVQWLSFTYQVGEDGIEMKSGVISRNHRTIPFDRVQDVNLEQNPIHRLLRMGKVKLETGGSAGGTTEDGVIDSITLDDAARLRDTIRAYRSGAVASSETAESDVKGEEAARTLFAMDLKRVLTAGIFNFSLAVIGVLFGFAQTVGDIAGINPFSERFWRSLAADGMPYMDFILANRIVTGIFGFISLIIVGLATGIIQTLLRDFGFRLDRTESGFRRRRGLLTLTDVVLPLKRVQAVVLATGPIRKRFGWSALKLQSLARDSGHGGDHVVAPLARDGEIDAIVHAMDWRGVDRDKAGWKGPTVAYVASFLMIVVPATIAGLAIASVDGNMTVLGIVTAVAVLVTVPRLVAWKHHGYKRDGDRIMIRSGAWRQRRVLLPLDRIQSVDLTRNPVDRLFGVASVVFGVAGGRGFDKHAILSIPHEDASALRAHLIADA